MKWFHIVLCLAAVSGALAPAEEQEREQPKEGADQNWQVIYEVTEIALNGTKVTASGIAASHGWKNARLEPFKEDADGIYRFKFQAQPPEGAAAQALAPIGPVEYDFKKLPANLHKIVVEAAQNKKELLYTGGAGNSAAEEGKKESGSE